MSRHLYSASPLFVMLATAPAFADLTVDDVWQDWQGQATSSGYALSASTSGGGGSLTISDIALTIDLGEDGTVNVDYGDYTAVMTEENDGSVSIALSESTTMTLDVDAAEEDDVSILLDITQAAPTMQATGDPGNITYTFATDMLTLALAGVETGGVILTDEVARFDIEVSDMRFTSNNATAEMRTTSQQMEMARIGYDMAFADPTSDDSFAMTGEMQAVSFGGSGILPTEGDAQDINAMLSEGFSFEGNFLTTGGSYTATVNSSDGGGTINATSTGGASFRIAMDSDGLDYEVEQRGLAMNALMTDLPIPVSFEAETASTSLRVPVQKSDDPQDFALSVGLSGFKMADMLWGLFDPAGQLPRDPAKVLVDLSGQAKLLFDYLDPAQAAVLDGAEAAPGELNALSLNALEVDMVGAKLTGAGDFVFDNSDLVSFDGLPRPEGAVDLTLIGGNGLLDKLVGMGLVPEEDAMGARMMMGLFAVPGAGEDTLTSRIEVNTEGHVLANGQRLR